MRRQFMFGSKAMATGLGTGITIAFGTTSFTCEVLEARGVGKAREAIRSSHMGTTANHTWVAADLSDAGGVEVDCHHDYDQEPPIDAAEEVITITFPLRGGDTLAATIVGTGFITDWDWGAGIDTIMTGSFTLKWSDVPTYTNAT